MQNDSSKLKQALREIKLSHYTQPSTFTEHVASAYITLTKGFYIYILLYKYI